MAAPLHDLLTFDRDISRAHDALLRWRAALARDPEKNADNDPFAPFRHTAGQKAYDALREQSIDEPLKSALLAWVHTLTDARVVADLDVEWAREGHAAAARLGVGTPRMVSYVDAWRGVVTSIPRPEALAWLDAAAARGGEMSSIARQRSERRMEVARRLDLTHPSADQLAVPAASLEATAENILRETDDMWRALDREARAKAGLAALPPSPVDAVSIAVAREAPEGWPAQLTARWLAELFAPAARGLRIDLPLLPPAVGASSFARALGAFGYALRVAGRSRSMPFVLACAPSFVDAHRYALAFAHLAWSPTFQRRALGVSSRVANAQARTLAQSALFDARISAARYLLGDPARPPAADRFEEITFRAFGSPLPPDLRGAWPPPRDDEPARFLARATALAFERDLVERFDVDWFMNPHATDFLRGRASGPAWEDPAPPLDTKASARALGQAFESVLA